MLAVRSLCVSWFVVFGLGCVGAADGAVAPDLDAASSPLPSHAGERSTQPCEGDECAVACATDADCPAHYVCAPVGSGEFRDLVCQPLAPGGPPSRWYRDDAVESRDGGLLVNTLDAAPDAGTDGTTNDDAAEMNADAGSGRCVDEGTCGDDCAFAPTFRVGCPCSDFDSIGAALSGVPDGARIEVCAGTYLESLGVERPVELVGIDGREVTVLDATGHDIGVIVRAPTARLEGFTVRGASGPGVAPERGAVDITDCRLTGNRAGLWSHASTLNVTRTVIDHNETILQEDERESLVGVGAMFWRGEVTLVDSTIADNRGNRRGMSAGGTQGIGLHMMQSTLTLRDTVIERNTADIASAAGTFEQLQGIGVFAFGGSVRMERTAVRNNIGYRHAGTDGQNQGAGMFEWQAPLEMIDSVVEGNGFVVDDGTRGHHAGGGIFLWQTTMHLVRSHVRDNLLTDRRASPPVEGAGIFIWPSDDDVNVFEGGSIALNRIVGASAGKGGAIACPFGCGALDADGTDFGEGPTNNVPDDLVLRNAAPVSYGAAASFYCPASGVPCVAECTTACPTAARCTSAAACASGACTSGRCE